MVIYYSLIIHVVLYNKLHNALALPAVSILTPVGQDNKRSLPDALNGK